jgi:hypothetical protein
MKPIHEFSAEQVMELLDTATDALEAIANPDTDPRGVKGTRIRIAEDALQAIGEQTEKWMRQ